jgi:spore maturation protein CgeB
MNFLTDDPWNPHHTARWFMRALPEYDIVFTPRKANIEDLRLAGCTRVQYLPFAYSPDVHYPDPPVNRDEEKHYGADVFFAGGADADRVPYIAALIDGGLKVALYGSYWGRYRETRTSDRGPATSEVMRKAAFAAAVSLCLVRRANRDGHSMRTYELAASSACILAEDTEDHREILGKDGISAVYFRSIPEMVEQARAIIADRTVRNRIAAEARSRICSRPNTYADRFREIAAAAEEVGRP